MEAQSGPKRVVPVGVILVFSGFKVKIRTQHE